jgi:hypothetical protein
MVPKRPTPEMAERAHPEAMEDPTAWSRHIRAVDRALDASDVDRARRAWEKAHRAAVASIGWEGLLETGQACLRIGGATGGRPAAEPAARRAYFTALYRACHENSSEGILRLAEAFEALGDHQVVEECLGLMELQGDGEPAQRRVAGLAGRLGDSRRSAAADGAGGPSGAPWVDPVGGRSMT